MDADAHHVEPGPVPAPTESVVIQHANVTVEDQIGLEFTARVDGKTMPFTLTEENLRRASVVELRNIIAEKIGCPQTAKLPESVLVARRLLSKDRSAHRKRRPTKCGKPQVPIRTLLKGILDRLGALESQARENTASAVEK